MKLRRLQVPSGFIPEICALTPEPVSQAEVRGAAEGAGHQAAEGAGLPGRHCEADRGFRGGGHGRGGAGSCHRLSRS